jgi:DNA-binding NtrC family response regulator
MNENHQDGLIKGLPFTGSPAFLERYRQVAEALKRHKTILITGEAGTGKTALAKFLCQHSPLYHKTMKSVRLDEIPTERTRPPNTLGSNTGLYISR